jgi:hypothetical protein
LHLHFARWLNWEAAMRVTIEHREATSGLLGNRKDTYIECRVDFSEEEKAIIAARDLYRSGFTVRTSTPLPTQTAMLGSGLMRPVGVVMMIVGVVWGIAGGGTPTGLLFFGGLGLFIFGWLRTRKEDHRLETSEQEITVKKLLADPSFTVHAWNPAAAKSLDEDIRNDLAGLKQTISASADIQAKQTFEL